MVVPNRIQITSDKYIQGYDINFNSYEPSFIVVMIRTNDSLIACELHSWLTSPTIYSSAFLIVPLRHVQKESPVRNMNYNLIISLK